MGLRAWNSPALSAPASSAVARIQLDVLKHLSLRDGDCAYLEKHLLVERGAATTTAPVRLSSRANDTILQKVVVRLELMDEDEEEHHRHKPTSEIDRNGENNLCLVPPVVLANLGIPPQVIWRRRDALSEEGVGFRLRAIHDNDDEDGEDRDGNSSSDDEDLAWTFRGTQSLSPRRRRRKRRKRIAGRVLLRPLGRSTRWPWFEFRPTKSGRTPSPQSQDNENNDNDNDNNDRQREGLPTQHDDDLPRATAADEQDDESGDESWIYPSRAGIVLQESKLCEVRYNIKRNKGDGPQEQKTCYYEVLRIEEARDNKFVFTEEEGEEDDDCFYLTNHSTQFELDSYPLSSHSIVRRLPLPLPFCGIDDDKTTATDDERKLREGQQSPEDKWEETIDSMVTPRRLFASSEETGQPHENDPSIEDEASEASSNCFSFHPDWETVATALLDAPQSIKKYNTCQYHGARGPLCSCLR